MQERPQNFHLEMIRVNLVNMLGIEAMLKSEHIRLRKNPPIPWVCTTCTAMFGSGAKIGMEIILILRKFLIPKDLQMARPLSCAAARGATPP